jgi:hypothetical protein
MGLGVSYNCCLTSSYMHAGGPDTHICMQGGLILIYACIAGGPDTPEYFRIALCMEMEKVE